MSKQLWTPEEIVDRIRLLHKSGNDLSHGNAITVAPRLVGAAVRYFGSWKRAVEEAEVDYAAFAKAARQRSLARRAKWSEERVVECIRNAAERKEPLDASVVSRRRQDLYGAARSYFGGWEKALKAAGIRVKPYEPGKRCEHTKLLNRWKRGLLLEKVSQFTSQDRFIDERSIQVLAPALHEALISRYGSWTAVLRAAEGVIEPKRKRRLGQDD